jgi:hypothetical protein
MVYWKLRGLVCSKLGGLLAGDEYKLCECVGRQRGLCGRCLIRVTSMHYIKSLHMFKDDLSSPEHAIVTQGGSLGDWVGGVICVI